MAKKFGANLSNAQIALARRFEAEGITSFSQAIKALDRRDNVLIAQWMRELDEKMNPAPALLPVKPVAPGLTASDLWDGVDVQTMDENERRDEAFEAKLMTPTPATEPEFVNLTPHDLNVENERGEIVTIPRGGTVARVAEQRVALRMAGEFTVYRVTYDAVQGLPDPEPGKIYIVSSLVAARVPEREDVLAPGEAIRDADGKIIGARGFARI